jgi:putative membrane protein
MEVLANERKSYLWIIVISVLIPVVVALLLFMPTRLNLGADFVYFLPHLNGVINTATSIALLAGYFFIGKKNIALHRASMSTAFILGSIFLVSYVVYHASAESTIFGGEGIIRGVYYFLLITHIILAAVVVPFVLFAFYFALSGKIDKHKKIVKYTFPIWLYVSVTGVIVYLMISPYYNF